MKASCKEAAQDCPHTQPDPSAPSPVGLGLGFSKGSRSQTHFTFNRDCASDYLFAWRGEPSTPSPQSLVVESQGLPWFVLLLQFWC